MHPADETGVDQLLGDAHLGPETLIEADLQDDARGGAGLDHGAGVGQGRRQRLLAEHRLAGRGRHLDGGAVEAVGRRDQHRLDGGIGDQRLGLGVPPFGAPGAPVRLGPRGVLVRDGDQPRLGQPRHGRPVAQADDGAGADDAEADWLRGGFRSGHDRRVRS